MADFNYAEWEEEKKKADQRPKTPKTIHAGKMHTFDNRFSRVMHFAPHVRDADDDEDYAKIEREGSKLWKKLIQDIRKHDETGEPLQAPRLEEYFQTDPKGATKDKLWGLAQLDDKKKIKEFQDNFKFHYFAWAKNLLAYYIFDAFLRNWINGDVKAKLNADYHEQSAFFTILQDFIDRQDQPATTGEFITEAELKRRDKYAKIFTDDNVRNEYLAYIEKHNDVQIKRKNEADQRKKKFEADRLEDNYDIWKKFSANNYANKDAWEKEAKEEVERRKDRQKKDEATDEKDAEYARKAWKKEKNEFEQKIQNESDPKERESLQSEYKDAEDRWNWQNSDEAKQIRKEQRKRMYEKRDLENNQLYEKIRKEYEWKTTSGRQGAPESRLGSSNRAYSSDQNTVRGGKPTGPDSSKEFDKDKKNPSLKTQPISAYFRKKSNTETKNDKKKLNKSRSDHSKTKTSSSIFDKFRDLAFDFEDLPSKMKTQKTMLTTFVTTLWNEYINLYSVFQKVENQNKKTALKHFEQLDKIFSTMQKKNIKNEEFEPLKHDTLGIQRLMHTKNVWFGLVSDTKSIRASGIGQTLLKYMKKPMPENVLVFYDPKIYKSIKKNTVTEYEKNEEAGTMMFAPIDQLSCDTYENPEPQKSFWFIQVTKDDKKTDLEKKELILVSQYFLYFFSEFYFKCGEKKWSRLEDMKSREEAQSIFEYFVAWFAFRLQFPKSASLSNSSAPATFYPLFPSTYLDE